MTPGCFVWYGAAAPPSRASVLSAYNLLMAATLVNLVPVVALFFVAQRYFIQGIVISGVKG